MGQAHFDMMYAEASEVDRRAGSSVRDVLVAQVAVRAMPNAAGQPVIVGRFWQGVLPGPLFCVFRSLLQAEASFTQRLQELLCNGRVKALVPTPLGKIWCKDPELFEFDDAVLEQRELQALLALSGPPPLKTIEVAL